MWGVCHHMIRGKSKVVDKWIRSNPKRANGVLICGMRGHPTGPILDLPVGWGERGERKRELRERSSTFSLNFPAIGPAVSSGARRKVHPCGKSFTSRL